MIRYVAGADHQEHLQTIPYIDPALRMKENSAWQFCVGSGQQGYMDNKFVLMSLYLYRMRHSSHSAHFNPKPVSWFISGGRSVDQLNCPLGRKSPQCDQWTYVQVR